MTGKSKCKILKQIRAEIAKKNDIEYTVSECTFQGNCKGTCPKCEEEVRYLEEQLARRKMLGKAVCVAGISACVMTGCMHTGQDSAPVDTTSNSPIEQPLGGEVAPEESSLATILPTKVPPTQRTELEGDVEQKEK